VSTTSLTVILGVVVQLVTAAFVYGRLTERVKTIGDRTIDHGTRITNVETVLSGSGGHGERLTALEARRLHER
jgi:hypothetical protein